MEFKEVVKNRYSCKKYDGQPVSKEALDAILEAGRLAPTARNAQEQKVYVIQSPEGLAKIDAATPCRYNAPVVLAVAYDKAGVYTYPGESVNSGMEDAAIVATHMMLAATDVGVESCWLNFFNPVELKSALGLPENEELVMLLDLGHVAEGSGPFANHESRKDISQTVAYI